MNQHQRRWRTGASYWITLVGTLAFWLFGLYIASLMLSMSATGKLDGPILLNAAVTLYVFIWLTMTTSSLVAVWKARNLTREVQLAQLARMSRPVDPVTAGVWWWMKAAWWSWLAVMGSMALALLTGLLGLW